MNIAQIIALAPQHSLMDCYRVLHDFILGNGGDPLHHMRIRPFLSLSLPAKQVNRVFVERDDDFDIYTIEVNLAGLYGQLSPMPTFFTEELIQSELIDNNQARFFLDLLHQRFYQIFILLKQKHTSYETKDQVQACRSFMFSLASLRHSPMLETFPEPDFLLRNINVLRHEKGTIMGLKNIFKGLFSPRDILIRGFVVRHLRIDSAHVTQLGRPKNELGKGTLIGNTLSDAENKISIVLDGINATKFEKWILSKDYFAALQQLTHFILDRTCLVDLQVNITTDKNLQGQLGVRTQGVIGKNIWLGQLPKLNNMYCANIRLI